MIVLPRVVRWSPWTGNHQNSSTLTSGDQEMVPVCLGTPIPAVFPRFLYNNRSSEGSRNLGPTSFPNSYGRGFFEVLVWPRQSVLKHFWMFPDHHGTHPASLEPSEMPLPASRIAQSLSYFPFERLARVLVRSGISIHEIRLFRDCADRKRRA